MSLKSKRKPKPKGKPNRKELRKEKRKEKKVKRNDYYTKRGKSFGSSELKSIGEESGKQKPDVIGKTLAKSKIKSSLGNNKVLSTEDLHRKEKREQKKMKKDMSKQRKDQLLKANAKEDQTIRKLEKQLKLHKRKTKTIPKSFVSDGLDYLLEMCDPEFMKSAAAAEQDLNDGNDNFEEDFALMTGQTTNQKMKKPTVIADRAESEDENDSDSFEALLNEDDESDEDLGYEDEEMSESYSDDDKEVNGNQSLEIDSGSDTREEKKRMNKLKKPKQSIDSDKNSGKINVNKKKEVQKAKNNSENSDLEEELSDGKKSMGKRKLVDINSKKHVSKKAKKSYEFEKNFAENIECSDEDIDNESDKDEVDDETSDNKSDKEKKEIWEDIYGRLRSKDGAVLDKTKEGKYIPPAIRAKMEASGSEDKKGKEKLERLKKQLKGLLNRLAESNMHSIASQIENFYMNNSRNDMSETMTSLIEESLISNVLSPERLLMEHMVLIAILHANVGTEVGAHFLQVIIKKFDTFSKTNLNVEDKSLDNTVNILAQLYNFKVFDARLLYEILQKLAGSFQEKNVECILHILRSVGFGLRKDDPLALKNLILELQRQAASATEGKVSNSRVKFLLDVLLAIKNNNVTKIPNYDTTYSEHLKKIMKGFIRKGNYVTTLNISLEDLLKADERGKWWVVGSAWTGNIENTPKKEEAKSDSFSQKLLDLARKQRMNTDTRRDIFCVIMSAEDYMDAFEKLLRLGLKNQQEREIIHVILHCCLQEKVFNPYYAILAQKLCEYDRKFQMTIKCSVWDKLKILNSHSGGQLSNLAKLLTHLFIEKGLPISTLKIVEFSELDKMTLRLMRQILLGILLHDDLEAVQGVFEKVAQSDKLKMFRESLRLFIHHFLLRNLKTESVPEDQKQILEDRAKMVERILTAKDSRLRL